MADTTHHLLSDQVGVDNVAKIADFGISKMVQGSAHRLHEQVIEYFSFFPPWT